MIVKQNDSRSEVWLHKIGMNWRDVDTMIFTGLFAQSLNHRLTLWHVAWPSNLPPKYV